jgi:hypothetical protein
MLTAVPNATVTVGNRVFATPVRDLRVPAGSYQVTFRNETSESPLSQWVSLKSGELRKVHADFTSEPPRIVVQ